MHRECRKEASLTNVNNTPVVEEPKAAEKPTLVLSIGSGTYHIEDLPYKLEFVSIS